MALCHFFFGGSANKIIYSPKSGLSRDNLRAFETHSKSGLNRDSLRASGAHFIIASKQNIHISKNGQNGVKKLEAIQIKHAKALEEVKLLLASNARKNANEGLSMVDSIQKLGIEYHFEEEIEAVLERKKHLIMLGHQDQELSQVALHFRLLRQQGYNIPAGIFGKFLDKKGKLKHTFYEDIDGLIALFEASQVSTKGEHCLHEAGELSRQYLNAWLLSTCRDDDHPQVKIVEQTLRTPIHKSLSRFMYTGLHLENAGWTSSLHELSKIDTQIVSCLHLKEISSVTKWWKELGLANDLKLVRDEPIKWYMWPMACIPDPQFSEARIEITKPVSLIYIIDDIFDFYGGSIDELTLFTDAVKRWDLAAMEQLPDCMKVCFKALYDITNEFAFKIHLKHGWNPIDTLTKLWVRLLNAFLQEAKWFASGEVPKADEYLKNGIVSTGVHLVLAHAFFFMGQGLNEENVSLMEDFPSIVSTTATILRLCDDLEGDKDVNCDNGNDGSYLKCYMKENPGICHEEAKEHIIQQISDAWKQLNQECMMTPNSLPSSFNKLCLNAARMVPLVYSYDGNSPSKLEEYVKSLMIYRSGSSIQSCCGEDQIRTIVS